MANLRRSLDNCIRALDGKKRIDLYQSARVDTSVSIEDAMRNMKVLVGEGKFDHIGLSEVAADTIRRANEVSLLLCMRDLNSLITAMVYPKVHPIAAVEVEVSPSSYEAETRKVLDITRELGIPVIAYSLSSGIRFPVDFYL